MKYYIMCVDLAESKLYLKNIIEKIYMTDNVLSKVHYSNYSILYYSFEKILLHVNDIVIF